MNASPARPSKQAGIAPLAGVRVLDLTWALAGPYGSLHLALLGAEVIKVETSTALDAMRRGIYALSADHERSPTFNSINLNKLGLRLNLKHSEGLALFKELASISDVVVENFRPGVLQRMGLGYDILRELNPTIIVASSSAFGATGPESRRPGYASIFNAVSGLGHLTGYADGPPTEMRDSIDLRVGSSLAYAVLTALFHRRRTGQGQRIDLSSVEAIVSLVGHTVVGYGMTGEASRRQGNADSVMAPHGIYRCQDDASDGPRHADTWVSIAVDGDAEFKALCRAIGASEMAAEPRYGDAALRKRHEHELDDKVRDWTAQRTPREVTKTLQGVGVAAFPVMSTKDLVHDPHTKARGTWRTVTHPTVGRQTVQGLAWKSSDGMEQAMRHGPLLGQDNDYILGEVLGVPREKIQRMTDDGVFQ